MRYFKISSKRFRALLCSILTILLFVTPFFSSVTVWALEEQGIDQKEFEEFAKEKVQTLSLLYRTTGVQYAIYQEDKPILTGESGFSDMETKMKVTKETQFPIASISKMFVTKAVTSLVEEGKLSLNQPVVSYLPEFKMADERYRDITVKMLLNHSSGLMGTTQNGMVTFGFAEDTAHDSFLASLQAQRLKADPGQTSNYCNDGFTLAEILIEKVTGQRFYDYIKEKFLEPLGMEGTILPTKDQDTSLMAKSYSAVLGKSYPVESVNAFGAGGLYSTAEELCSFSKLFYNEEESNLLGWDFTDLYPLSAYGIKVFSKGGDTQLAHASFLILPEYKISVAVLTTGASSTVNQMFAQELLLWYFEKTKMVESKTLDTSFVQENSKKMPKELKKEEGIYSNVLGNGQVKVDVNKNQMKYLGQIYQYQKDGSFLSTNKKTKLSFIKEKGKTYLYKQSFNDIPGFSTYYSSDFLAQKAKVEKLSKKLTKIWEKRSGKRYLLVNEPYSSQLYQVLPSLQASVDQNYYHNAEIINKTTASMQYTVPGHMGRDLYDLKFVKEKEQDFLFLSNGLVAVAEDNIKVLPKKEELSFKLDKETGYANWYRIDEAAVSQKLTVNLPEKTAFMVYSEKGVLRFSSFLEEKNTVTLEEPGYLIFVGLKGSEFTVTQEKGKKK